MRKKLIKYNELSERANVLEPGMDGYKRIKGHWSKFFDNNNELILELACGRGEYTNGLAELYPNKNFIGVDLKGDRLWKASVTAEEKGLNNTAFLRTKIEELDDFFEAGEVSEIWITFPDPRSKGRDERRRLTSPRFLDIYKKVIKQYGILHLKTDNTGLFDFTLEMFSARTDIEIHAQTNDLYNSELNKAHHGIKTRYEKKHSDLGESIKYMKFSFM